MAKMVNMPGDLGKLCEALGVERPNEVTRVVLDIRAGHIPVLLVERFGDADKIVAALSGPDIEVRRDDPGAPIGSTRAPQVVEHATVRTCACTAGDACDVPWHWKDVSTVDGKE
jgi:hypothetical protein